MAWPAHRDRSRVLGTYFPASRRAVVASSTMPRPAAAASGAKSNDVKIPFMTKLVTGAVAGVIGTCCVFPIDIVKTRLQNQVVAADGSRMYRNPWHCFRTILSKEGVGGLYRGLGANLVGVSPEKAIKLAVNDYLREILADEHGELSVGRQILAGAGAGFFQVSATNPMEIVKIRMQMQAIEGTNRSTLSVVKELGFTGLYRGVLATWARDIPYSIIFFPGYAILKDAISDENGHAGVGKIIFAGGCAGAAAGGAVTPQDVIKTRLQTKSMEGRYSGVLDCGRKIIAEEGAGALFKGALNRMMVQAPLFGIALLAFELQKEQIRKVMRADADKA